MAYTILGKSFSLCGSDYYFLHLQEIMEGLYFHYSLSVCLCVCLIVACERSFCYMAAYRTGWDPIEIGDPGSKVKVTAT